MKIALLVMFIAQVAALFGTQSGLATGALVFGATWSFIAALAIALVEPDDATGEPAPHDSESLCAAVS